VSQVQKGKPVWILLKQETVSSNGISKSAPRSRKITTPAPHYSVFLQTKCRPTNSINARKAQWPIKIKFKRPAPVILIDAVFGMQHILQLQIQKSHR